MQGLADGYFILPATIGHYLASADAALLPTDAAEFEETERVVHGKVERLLGIGGNRTAQSFHKELGHVVWEHCGMSRNKGGLEKALERIPELREEFWENVRVPGRGESLNQALEYAGRVADFLEFGELMCRDALHRDESCGGHFREEHQTPEGEALRDDAKLHLCGRMGI